MSAERLEELFNEVLELPPAERLEFLERACTGQPELLRRLQGLIEAHDRAETLAFFTPKAPPPHLDQPRQRIGPYLLRQQLGEGGWGVVFLAEQQKPVHRQVALKVIKAGLDTRHVIARFEAEREALARMDHPNIAKVLDAGATETGRPYFVMELVAGSRITDYCAQNRLRVSDRLELFTKVCQAVQHAHQKGIIHRDLKPSNILVAEHDGMPVPKVIDFGIAKATEGRLTDYTAYTGGPHLIGTPAYMSPEQTVTPNPDVDTRSDIYSLGVLLYELLVGKTPFDSKKLQECGWEEMCRMIREQDPLRPSALLATLPEKERAVIAHERETDGPELAHRLKGDLDWIAIKCLAKERARRYETANGLAADLQRYLNTEPVLARPPSHAYRLQKFLHRHRTGVRLAVVVGAVVIGLMVFLLEEFFRAEELGRVAMERARMAQANELAARQSLYASDTSLAGRAWQEHNRSVVLNFLNAHRPRAGQEDLRGWEWRFLWGVSRSDELDTFTTLNGAVNTLAISPDGKLLAAAGSYEGGGAGVRLWDIGTRQQVAIIEGEDATGSLAFSPDGAHIAYATRHQGVRLWNTARRSPCAQFQTTPEIMTLTKFYGTGLAFSRNGHSLAFPQAPYEVGVVELGDESTVAKLPTGDKFGANALLFVNDDKVLVSAANDSVQFWSLPEGKRIDLPNQPRRPALRSQISRLAVAAWKCCLALSPDGTILASGGYQFPQIQITDLRSNRTVAQLTNHAWFVSSLAFSPDGKTLASGSGDLTIKLWNTTTWEETGTLQGSLEEIWTLAYSRDGNLLFSGAKDGSIKIWDGKTRHSQFPSVKLPEDATRFRVLPGCQTPLCEHTNGTVTFWDPHTLRPLGRFRNPLPEIPDRTGVALIASDDRLLVATKESGVIVWDLRNERSITNLYWSASNRAQAVSPDDQRLASATTNRVTIWDLNENVAGAISPNGRRFAFATTNRLMIWDLNTLEEVAVLSRPSAIPGGLCLTRDGDFVAVANEDRTIEVWDLHSGIRVGSWKSRQQGLRDMAFIGKTSQLIVVHDSTITIWDPATQLELPRFPRTQQGFKRVAVSPDGLRVAAAAMRTDAPLWNLATGQQLMSIPCSQDGADYLSFSADGNALLSVTSTELKLWPAPSWDEIGAAEAEEKTKSQ